MSSSRRRPASRLSVFALAASTVFLCLAPANAAQPFEQKGRLCAPAAEMSVLSGALAAGGYLDRPTQDASVAVRRYRGDLRLHNAALGIDVTASLSGGAQSDACKIFPKDQTLASAGAIPITYVASFARVLRYRTVHPPIDGANLTEVRTLASMAAYGPYVLISLWTLPPPGPIMTLSCSGGEYYRVDSGTNGVLPFDGCVEGHKRVLPGLSQLPPA